MDPEASSSINETTGTTATASSTADEPTLSTPPPVDKHGQWDIFTRSVSATLEVGLAVYLVPKKWYNNFAAWAQESGQEPGRVDPVAVLCDLDGALLEGSTENRDWVAVNQEGWSMVQQW